MYRCMNSSKFITRERLLDDFNDCDYRDDEMLMSIAYLNTAELSETHFKCTATDKYISRKLINDGTCACSNPDASLCDDEYSKIKRIVKHISFSTMCDDFVDLESILIDGRNETDETECEQWQCNNIYTRCDGIFNCLDGRDELNCNQSSSFDCQLNHIMCVSLNTSNFICIPNTKINDGKVDCLGATDEPKLCRTTRFWIETREFGCHKNATNVNCINFGSVCDITDDCINNDNENFCKYIRKSPGDVCNKKHALDRSPAEDFLCNRLSVQRKPRHIYFSLTPEHVYIEPDQDQPNGLIEIPVPTSKVLVSIEHYCHRGLNLRVWFDREKNLTRIVCLCPPSYYGDRCEYQNQRVSLTLQFRSFSDTWRTPFILIILLIDNSDERIIHSYQQLTYLPVQNCNTKYNIHLLYSTRPKNQSKLYFIHMDVYEKITLSYRGSLLIPIPFPFLPVERIVLQLDIPYITDNLQTCSDYQCIHGQCTRYFGDANSTTFCQCYQGWSGRYCTISQTCTCAPSSLCLGVTANNRSIYICPINKWGSCCLLHDHICQSADANMTCQNGGQCISIDKDGTARKKFECICSKDFYGDRCQISRNQIILSFQKDMILPTSMFVHFIEIRNNSSPESGLTFKPISTYRQPIIIYWSRIFHIAFAELFTNDYYLITVQTISNSSIQLVKTITLSDRCPNIGELLDKQIIKLHLLRRIKHYHQSCQQHSNQVSCFYDDTHFCLCQDFSQQRIANCFEFNHTMEHNCHGRSICENGGKCLQDSVTCAETSICVCSVCFYGRRCQFTTSGFSLSLDGILGYHIQPHVNIRHQPIIVQISIVFTTFIVLIGSINGVLSLITFNNRELNKIGCGIYLLVSSINILITMILIFVKFSILLAVQMTYVTNRLFLNSQCKSIDFLLRIGLNMDQWLNACVAIDRATAAIQGISFNKKRSRKFAIYIIIVLFCLVFSTNIQDPLYRKLIDEDNNDEQRIWCIVSYSSSITLFDKLTGIMHFFGPFIINIISALIIIVITTRSRSAAQRDQMYRTLLYQQLQQHKQLLIAPISLVILAIPRLIISFLSGCMKSINDSWLFLVGYYISFVPLMLTFILFVVPSNMYKTEFYKTVTTYRQKLRSRLNRTP